ncbi:sensor histidine kinase [Halorubrum californiense]|uniref:sensor histidine kinase n=1 Tax=Halorubrum californiense TaxID=416585 RepID=UPI0031B57D60
MGRTGDSVSELEPVDLANLTANCWKNVDTAGASLTTEIDRQVLADQNLLQQLFENLIRNAIDHGSPDVTVEIGELDGGFYIEDDGPGIADKEQDAIFELGYSTAENGIGLGLSIVKQVTHAHGWDIHVTDSSLGGARFEITGAEFAHK